MWLKLRENGLKGKEQEMMKEGEEAGESHRGTVLPWHGGCTYPGGSGESGKEAGQERSRFRFGFSKVSLSAVSRMERMEAEGQRENSNGDPKRK